ncbi:MAG TPA: galactokinase [Ignavibacteriaceae bacterium]|nr:galactokinase [Ignavibacteriaceae bacterium]
MELSNKIKKKFKELFNEEPLIVRSPGRVNLIGEHTDYNYGFVLPAAIDMAVYFGISSRSDKLCTLFASDMNESYEFSLDKLLYSDRVWPNYLIGIVDQLIKRGYKLSGFNCVFGGNIPIGAGLSSSAAIEAGLAFALNHLFNLGIDKLELVKISQKAENEFVGVNCGIMDQYINLYGEDRKALRIDCRSLEHEYFPFDYKNISIVLFNSNVSHSLASSEYNQRRKECSIGVDIIKREVHEVESLRDVSADLLKEFQNKIDPTIYRRCKYVIEENARLLKACDALKIHDLNTFGSLMYQTHEGLSNDYEVSCKELDYLVDMTLNIPKVYGSRMMGGGFGGCTINLIENEAIDEVSKYVTENYKNKFNLQANTYITKISGGTNIISIKENATA